MIRQESINFVRAHCVEGELSKRINSTNVITSWAVDFLKSIVMLAKILLCALALSLHLMATHSASLLDMGLGALAQLQHQVEEENGNGNGSYENGNGNGNGDDEEEEEEEEREVNPFHKLNSMQDGTEFPYLWPKFPFFPGLNFPPNYPDWMLARRPSGIPDVARLGWPDISLPWKRPGGDDDDDEEENGDDDDDEADIEECPDDGIKFISHPENCEQYILCIDGNEVSELDCPNDLHFSRDTRTCTDPDDAGCE